MKNKLLLSVILLAAAGALAAAEPGARATASRFSFADKNVSDDALHDAVMRRLANDADVKGGGLGIDVKDGVVTLTGKVETEKQKQKAEKLAKKVNGVKKVVNQITVVQK
ncbi:MAG TPA: BON domain-containing protein [Bryobacteraceae bacterium]|nr:BON domain-containing protein [Bryobacteraceae bacterium]